jgi:hypothetical protein
MTNGTDIFEKHSFVRHYTQQMGHTPSERQPIGGCTVQYIDLGCKHPFTQSRSPSCRTRIVVDSVGIA